MPGTLTIGRSPQCQIILDDPLVSRLHSKFHISKRIFIEDLGSRNGTYVNGKRIIGKIEVKPGDKIMIGTQEMEITKPLEHGKSATMPFIHCPTCGKSRPDTEEPCPFCGVYLVSRKKDEKNPDILPIQTLNLLEEETLEQDVAFKTIEIENSEDETTYIATPLTIMSNVAGKFIILKRYEEAEKLITRFEKEIETKIQLGSIVNSKEVELASFVVVKYVAETGNAQYLDIIFNMYVYINLIPPRNLVDELFKMISKVRYISGQSLDKLIANNTNRELSSNDKFVLRRLEGLRKASHNIS